MMKEIVIARMAWTGKMTPEGRYEGPVPEIVLDPNNQTQSKSSNELSFEIEKLDSDLVLKVPVQYKESSEMLDQPSFRMKVLDDNQNVLMESEQEYSPDQVGDQFLHFDTMDTSLSVTIPLTEFQPRVENRFDIELEATLEQWEWVDRKYKGTALQPLTETQRVTVIIIPLSIEYVKVSATIPSAVAWKQVYQITLTVENFSPDPIIYTVDILEVDPDGNEDEFGFARDEVPSTSGYLEPSTFDNLSSSNIKKSWGWWEQTGYYFCTPNHPSGPLGDISSHFGPYQKTFTYTVRFTLNRMGDVDVNQDYPITDTTTVTVSEAKETAGDDAYQEFINANAILLLSIAAGFLNPLVALILTVVYFIKVGEAEALALEAKACPVEFDKHYKKVQTPEKLQAPFRERKDIPQEVKPLTDAFDSFVVHQQVLELSSARYLSAMSREDTKSARKQKRQAEIAVGRLRDALIEMRTSLKDFRKYERRVLGKEGMKSIEDAFEKIRRDGIDKNVRHELEKQGTPDDVPDFMESHLKMMSPKDIKLRPSSILADTVKTLEEVSHGSILKMKRIERIQKLSKEDRQIELLDEGMISPVEFRKRRGRREIATDYLLTEISSMDSRERRSLQGHEISRISEMLRRCSNDREINKLARKTGISRSRIRRFVKIFSLMEIRGIGEKEATILVDTGVTSKEKLRKAKPTTVSRKIASRKDLSSRDKKRVTESKIVRWMKSIKNG